jgi:signal transduction histidine kinase
MFKRLFHGVGVADVGVAAALSVIGVAGAATAEDYAGGQARLVVALLLQTVPLVWWRVAPLRAVALSALGVGVEVAGVAAWGDVAGFFGYLALVFGVARWASARDRLISALVLGAGFVVHLAAQPNDGMGEVVGSLISAGVLSAAAWGFGSVLRTRANREERLRLEAGERERRWESDRKTAIEEERRRIARDLHDIVGHALAAISLSAAAAETCLPADAQDARSTLGMIGTTSRQASDEVRRLVGLLRTDGDAEGEGMTPQPTLARLDELVTRARDAGLQVALDPVPEVNDIPVGIQLAAYRVVQEGLTNVAKHAPTADAQVTVRRRNNAIAVAVTNGGDAIATELRRGHGLVGLAERIALYDGELVAESLPEGGFRLAATVPIS